MILEIKAKHIRKGLREEPSACMVAVAAEEAGLLICPSASYAKKGDTGTLEGYVPGTEGQYVSYKISSRCAEVMRRFDDKGKKYVKPFRTRLTRVTNG